MVGDQSYTNCACQPEIAIELDALRRIHTELMVALNTVEMELCRMKRALASYEHKVNRPVGDIEGD